jgi:hypothetical protein
MRDKIIVNEEFQKPIECFKCFYNLIKKEVFDLIDSNTDDIPLDRLNTLLEEKYCVWVNIIKENRDPRTRKIEFLDDESYLEYESFYGEIDSFYEYKEYSFVFIEKNKKYKFLGLYREIEFYSYKNIQKWKKIEINEIYLDKKFLKNLIEDINFNSIVKYEEAKMIIEKFDYNSIKQYIEDKEKMKELLNECGQIYKFLPDNLKNDEELAIIAIKKAYYYGICKYIPKKLLASKEFAKKVMNVVNDSVIQYFSNEIKNDFEICKNAYVVGYPFISENVRGNKELALKALDEPSYAWNIRYINKSLKKDKDIIKKYWDMVKSPYLEWYTPCSIISIDSFGNGIIDEFLKLEKERHSKKRIYDYEENLELTQFVKVKKYKDNTNPFINVIDFDREIFDEELQPFIVIIGEKENSLISDIKEEYDNDYMIEIYAQNVETNHFKFITEDVNKIINLLRIITYTNDTDDDVFSEIPYREIDLKYMMEQVNNLIGIKNIQEEANTGIIEIYQCSGKLHEIEEKINEIPKNFVDKKCVVQIVGNTQLDVYMCANLCSKVFGKKLFFEDVGYFVSHICNIDDVEILIMKIN